MYTKYTCCNRLECCPFTAATLFIPFGWCVWESVCARNLHAQLELHTDGEQQRHGQHFNSHSRSSKCCNNCSLIISTVSFEIVIVVSGGVIGDVPATATSTHFSCHSMTENLLIALRPLFGESIIRFFMCTLERISPSIWSKRIAFQKESQQQQQQKANNSEQRNDLFGARRDV